MDNLNTVKRIEKNYRLGAITEAERTSQLFLLVADLAAYDAEYIGALRAGQKPNSPEVEAIITKHLRTPAISAEK